MLPERDEDTMRIAFLMDPLEGGKGTVAGQSRRGIFKYDEKSLSLWGRGPAGISVEETSWVSPETD
jgi:hypothetical protein